MGIVKIHINELKAFIKEIVNEELTASDGGYYTAPNHKVVVTKKEAEYIDNIAKALYNDLFTPDYTTIVNKGDDLKLEILNQLSANIKLEYDTETDEKTGSYNYYWIAENEDLELAKKEFNAIVDNLYDTVSG